MRHQLIGWWGPNSTNEEVDEVVGSKRVRLNNVQCEVTWLSSDNDCMCRIEELHARPKPREITDGYCPPPAGGLLWIRSLCGATTISGFVRNHLFASPQDLDDFLDDIANSVLEEPAQPITHVTVIGAERVWNRIFNGEQFDSYS